MRVNDDDGEGGDGRRPHAVRLQLRPTDPVAVCAEQARAYGPAFEVAGSFATTVREVRDLTPGVEPARWPELADETPSVVCFLDGSVPKSPPGGEPFDRALVRVAGEHAELIIAGYRDQLIVEAP
jgi:hypothetical protein